MSEFAYALSGEPFDVSPTVTGWRVKRIKPKGAPEVVYGSDGSALTLPVDAGMEDLRREAVLEGKYRLDPVGEDNRVIANAPAGYVYVHKQERGGDSQTTVTPATGNPLVEAMRLNTELARAVIDRFPTIVDSMSGLVRSVGGLDLPTRALHSFLGTVPQAEDDDVEQDDESDDLAPAPTLGGWAAVADKYGPQIIAGLRAMIESGLIKIPGGAGALVDCRLASAAGALEASAANAQGAQPAPGPRGPAPARGGGARRATQAVHGGVSAGRPPHDATGKPTNQTVAQQSTDMPTIDPASIAHLTAIQAGLTAEELALAQALLIKLSTSERNAWLTELRTLSVRDAIAEVRAVLGTDGVSHDNATQPSSEPAGVTP